MRFSLAALVVCACLGCNGGEHTTTVTGTVTFEDKPVTSGVINFRSASGSSALGGGIQPDGSYKADLPAGEYLVRIDSPPQYSQEVDAEGRMSVPKEISPRQVPVDYGSFEGSGLKLSVSGDASSMTKNFALK
jgi:hypothetical protein